MITTIVKVTLAQMRILEQGGTVGSHTYDPTHCFYVVDDGLVLPQDSGKYVIKTDDDGETYYYDTIDLTWNEISGKPSTFPPSAHTHSAADITTGTVAVARLPVGTAATQVAAGNHTHSAYVNQNAFGNVKVGSTTTAASSTTDTVTFAAGGDLGVSISGKTVSYSITLPTQLPASDVYSWAKAATKPTYSAAEISGVLPPWGNARSNLGDPTVFESGVIDSEFTNKFMSYTPDYVKIYRSSDGSTLTEATEYTDTDKRRLLVGDASTSLSIPVNTYLVLEFTSMEYVYLNMLYIYNSTSGTQFQYRIDTSYDKSSWSTLVNYGSSQSTWPGHTVIRHQTIPFQRNGTQGTHVGYIRVWIKCIQVSTSYTQGYIYKLQWWGGYPSGRRNYYYIDENRNYNFPASINATSLSENGTLLSNKYVALSGGTMTGQLIVKAPIFGYEYSQNTNAAAFVFDKPGSNYTGIGSHSESDTIYFGACGSGGAWVDSYKQKWKFNGTIIEDGTALSNKYLGITATATDSSKLNGQTSSYYLNYNNLDNKPSIPSITVSNGVIIFS